MCRKEERRDRYTERHPCTPSKTGQRFARGLDWNLLKAFHEIAQAGGVSRAARELSRKQPAISLSLQRLEDHLGVTLCRRGPGGFDLTDEGELVAEICRSMAGLVSGMPNRVADIAEDLHGRVAFRSSATWSTTSSTRPSNVFTGVIRGSRSSSAS